MQPHEERVVAEKKELDDKIVKLKKFICENPIFHTLPAEECRLLRHQFELMLEYSTTLWQRIMLFKPSESAQKQGSS